MTFLEEIDSKARQQAMEEYENLYFCEEKDYFHYKKTNEYKAIYRQKRRLLLIERFKKPENKNLLQLFNKMDKCDIPLEKAIQIIENRLVNNKIYYKTSNLNRLKASNLDNYKELIENGLFLTVTYLKDEYGKEISILDELVYNFLNLKTLREQNKIVVLPDLSIINFSKYQYKFPDELAKKIVEYFDSSKVFQLIFSNQRYNELRKSYQITNIMLKEIPDDYTKLYPQARLLNRHFILHIGDTNTGKTYEALQDLKIAESGTYLAPLRLLALEIQERLNEEGILCSMTTGEEEDIIPNSKHMSSTVEKLDINQYYDVCVIDEAQMIQDEDRGWAWTNAILGAYSEKIHICMSENAKDIVIKLIKLCGDTYEVINHTRNTELIFERKRFNFPYDIKDHDAFILFSRKKVLGVASDLEKRGIKASVIYGSLPYSVRKNEVRKFIEGETKVVVATDAIGMGMNLPIKRIIFMEGSKFDGKIVRPLMIPEVKQIAGRAGRRGIFNTGYVAAIEDVKQLTEKLFTPYTPIKYAKIQLPKTLVNLEMPLSNIIENWIRIPDEGCFQKSTMEHDLELCKMLEELNTTKKLNISKETMLDLISIPFDEKNLELEKLWMNLINVHFCGNDILDFMDMPNFQKATSLDILEQMYKEMDLYYSFAKTVYYNKNNFIKKITEMKEEIALVIMDKLKKKEIFRTCKHCGRKLTWDYPYGMCQKCHNKIYSWNFRNEDWY